MAVSGGNRVVCGFRPLDPGVGRATDTLRCCIQLLLYGACSNSTGAPAVTAASAGQASTDTAPAAGCLALRLRLLRMAALRLGALIRDRSVDPLEFPFILFAVQGQEEDSMIVDFWIQPQAYLMIGLLLI